MCNELIEETFLACGSHSSMAPVSSELRRKCRLIMELLRHCHFFDNYTFQFFDYNSAILGDRRLKF